MSITRKLVVNGFVQGVGYRAYVKQAALRLRVKGTVMNLPDGNVEIYCQARDEDTLVRFKDMLVGGVGEVEEIEEYLPGTAEYGAGPDQWVGFNTLRDEYSDLTESIEYVILGGIQIRGEIRDLGRKQDKMLEKQDKMLEGQDQTHAAIQTMDRHLGEKFDWLGDRYGEFGMKMSRLEEDIHVIKKASVELVKHITGKADSKTV